MSSKVDGTLHNKVKLGRDMVSEPNRKQGVKSDDGPTASDRILLAGRKLFSERSFDTVSSDDITREAGVAHGLLFHYFKSKLALYLEVYRGFCEERERRWRLATLNGSPDERLRNFIALHMTEVRSRAQNHIYVIRGGAPAPVLALAEAARMDGVRLVLSFYSDDEPSPTQLTMARAWLGFLTELVLAWITDEALEGDRVIEACVQMFNEIMKRTSLLESQG